MKGSTLRPPHCCAGIHSTWLPAPSWQPQPAPSLALRRAFFPSHAPGMPLLLKQNLLILDRKTRYQLFDGLWEAHALRPPFTTSPPNCILSPCCTSLQTLPKILARLIDAPAFFLRSGDGKIFSPFFLVMTPGFLHFSTEIRGTYMCNLIPTTQGVPTTNFGSQAKP